MKFFDKAKHLGQSIYVKMGAIMTAAYCVIVSSVPAFASASSSIEAGITNGTEAIWNILTAVVAPIAALALAICAIQIFWGGQRAAENAKSVAVKIIIGIAIVLLAPALIKQVKAWFGKAEWVFD